MLAVDRASWQNPRILTTLVMVFLCGALVGAITMRSGLHDKLHRSAAAYWKDGQSEFSYDRLKRDLNLTPDQAERLKTILDDFEISRGLASADRGCARDG